MEELGTEGNSKHLVYMLSFVLELSPGTWLGETYPLAQDQKPCSDSWAPEANSNSDCLGSWHRGRTRAGLGLTQPGPSRLGWSWPSRLLRHRGSRVTRGEFVLSLPGGVWISTASLEAKLATSVQRLHKAPVTLPWTLALWG